MLTSTRSEPDQNFRLARLDIARPGPDQTIDCHEIFPHGYVFEKLRLQLKNFNAEKNPIGIRIFFVNYWNNSIEDYFFNLLFENFITYVLQNYDFFYSVLSKSESVKFSLIKPAICIFTDKSVNVHWSNQWKLTNLQ